MQTRQLGSSGLAVSLAGLGCNNFGGMIDGLDLEAARAVIHAALDEGITLFDTADSYGAAGGSETVLGQVLGARRKDIVLATKFASPMNRAVSTRYDGSRRYVMGAVEASLRRLNTDWIDLYQYHFPDPLTPLDETLRALDDLVTQGKVRYIGCSNQPPWRIVEADWTARQAGGHRFLSTQAEYNLLNRAAESELLPALRAKGLSLLPYFPLASGLLTGKHRRGAAPVAGSRMAMPYFKSQLTDTRLDRVEELAVLAESHGFSLLELAFAFLKAEPAVASVIAGATRPEQVRANARALEKTLSPELAGALAQPPGARA